MNLERHLPMMLVLGRGRVVNNGEHSWVTFIKERARKRVESIVPMPAQIDLIVLQGKSILGTYRLRTVWPASVAITVPLETVCTKPQHEVAERL